MLDFKPPKDSPLLISLTNLFLPLYMKLYLGDTTIEVSSEAQARFRALKGQRALVCPNHANSHDPMVMFAFSRLLKEPFNYIAAREVFDWNNGLNGWWLQHLGAYSVIRGAVDRESFKMTRNLLTKGSKKLVLFPEGEISRQNDTLMPLESGAAQMSFWALSDLLKDSQARPDTSHIRHEDTLWIIPLALKYTYRKDITSTLSESLVEMGRKMGMTISDHPPASLVRSIAEKLLSILEQEYKQVPEEGETMNNRVVRLRRRILLDLARRLDIKLEDKQRELEQVRILRNAIDDIIFGTEKVESEYEKKIKEERAQLIKGGIRDLDRVVRFIAIYDGYFSEHMTQERLADIVERLEAEIMNGDSSLKGPRRVLIDVGEPIELNNYMEDYKANKRKTVDQVTDQIFSQISSMLSRLESQREAIFLKNDLKEPVA